MESITHNRFYKHFFYAVILCAITRSMYSMKRIHEEPSQSKLSMIEEKPPRTEKLNNIWIKTSDNQIIAMPEWQVNQIKVLQLLLINQKGTNSKNNPIEASH